MFRVKSDFLILDTLRPYPQDEEVEIVTGKNQKTYIYKSIHTESMARSAEIAETAAAFGCIYQIIMGPACAPTTFALVDKDRVGTLSEMIPGFTARADREHVVIEDIDGFARLLSAAFFLGERDLSLSNYGFTETGLICKIDHDLSGTDSLNLIPDFEDDFCVNAERLAAFPDMPKITNWPRKDISNIAGVLREKILKTFLLIAGIPEQKIEEIGCEHFSNLAMRANFTRFYIGKIQALRRVLRDVENLVVPEESCTVTNLLKTAEDKKYVVNLSSGGRVISGEDPLEGFDGLESQGEAEIYSQLGYASLSMFAHKSELLCPVSKGWDSVIVPRW